LLPSGLLRLHNNTRTREFPCNCGHAGTRNE
jgi:hypothetical protein